MPDPFEEAFRRIDRPRDLGPEFRARLESALVSGEAIEETGVAPRWNIDGPREMPQPLRSRIEASLVSRSRWSPRLLTTSVAAAIALLVVANSIVIAHRGGGPSKNPAVALPSTTASPLSRPTTSPPKVILRPPGSLQGFRSAGDFLRFVEAQALKLTGPYGISGSGGPTGNLGNDVVITPGSTEGTTGVEGAPQSDSAPSAMSLPAVGSYSGTNIQEDGVDELDTVKTDGRRIVVLTPSRLSVLNMGTHGPRLRGSIAIQDGTGVFLDGDRVIHVASNYDPDDARVTKSPLGRAWTKVSVIDISNLAAPSIASSLSVEGSFVGARLVGGVVRLIVRSEGLGPAPVPITDGSPTALEKAEAANKNAIRASDVGNWVPHFVARRGRTAIIEKGHVHDWTSVSRPPDKAGLGMLTVLTIDPANPRPDNAASIIGAGQIVYATPRNLYITSNRVDEVVPGSSFVPVNNPVTRIHKFDISDPLKATYVGSGEVAGYLLNQFSLSEDAGYLRVASTLNPPGMPEAGASQSLVTVLAQRTAKLVAVGKIGNLGRGERIYSVRFIGKKAYVVTFRQVDPLHVIDLSAPRQPKLVGELKVPGYSGYLHPMSDTLLLGVGRDADDQGGAKGILFSLFDVSNPAAPKLLHKRVEGAYGYSNVEQDHHAFLYWDPKNLLVVPASISDDPSNPDAFNGALALTVTKAAGFAHDVRLSHATRSTSQDTAIQRSLVIGDNLLTISNAGILVSDLETLQAAGTWVALPE